MGGLIINAIRQAGMNSPGREEIEAWLTALLAIGVVVGLGLLTLYALVRFAKWAWTRA